MESILEAKWRILSSEPVYQVEKLQFKSAGRCPGMK